MEDAILEARSLVKRFGQPGAEGPAVLDGIDFRAGKGEYVAVMGSSGSGKSTLLYLLAGLDRPTGGEVHFRGDRIDHKSEKELAILRRKGFGFVFQQSQLIPSLTLRDNALVPAHLANGVPAESMARVEKLLTDFGIAHLAQRLPSQVSGGEAQRAAIARALVNFPDAVLADEPTGALNRASGDAVLDCLSTVHRDGQTVVLVTHDLRAAVRADRVVYLRDGKVSGEYRFGSADEDRLVREKTLFHWLSERGW